MIEKTFNLENGLTIEVKTETDYDSDFSWLGRYTDNPTDEEFEENRVIDRGRNPREYRYFVAEYVENREQALENYDRVQGLDRGDWCFVGMIATVAFKDADLGHASLWGIESDSGEDYFLETAQELVHEAWEQAAKTLATLKGLELPDELPALDWGD